MPNKGKRIRAAVDRFYRLHGTPGGAPEYVKSIASGGKRKYIGTDFVVSWTVDRASKVIWCYGAYPRSGKVENLDDDICIREFREYLEREVVPYLDDGYVFKSGANREGLEFLRRWCDENGYILDEGSRHSTGVEEITLISIYA
jgi:hypothetical protein